MLCVRTATLQEKFCGAFSKATVRARRRFGVSFVSFSLRLLCQRKAGLRFIPYKIVVNKKLVYTELIVTIIRFTAVLTPNPLVHFFF